MLVGFIPLYFLGGMDLPSGFTYSATFQSSFYIKQNVTKDIDQPFWQCLLVFWNSLSWARFNTQ